MPTMVKPRPGIARAPAKAADAPTDDRPVLYPELTVNGIAIPLDKLRVRAGVARKLLGWENEEDYKKRCEASDDPVLRAKGIAGYGENFHCYDLSGRKVVFWNSIDNRPFDETNWLKITQDVLARQWAGYDTFGTTTARFAYDPKLPAYTLRDGTVIEPGQEIDLPDGTINGETVIIGRTGRVESAQHRLAGVVRAAELWDKNPKDYPGWDEEPYIETLVVFGVSENPTTVRTLDNVRPRTLADTIYTSDVFRRRKDGKLMSQGERKLLSKMLDAALDLLWRRTGAGLDDGHSQTFQTHSASFDFLDRHGGRDGTLVRLVKHLFEVNADRKISLLQLSAGQCAAAAYLMATADSDPAKYAKHRTETSLSIHLLDKAEEFFVGLADGRDRGFKRVQEALQGVKAVAEDGLGLGGRLSEKMAILAAAWGRFRADEEIFGWDTLVKDGGLQLSYGTDDNDNPVLLDPPTFGGIDLGQDPAPPEKVTEKQAEKAKAAAQRKKAGDALKATKGQGGSALDTLTELKKDHPGKLLLFADDGGDYNAYGEDAEAVAKDQGTEPRKGPGGIALFRLPGQYFELSVKQLLESGSKPAVVRFTNGVAEVVDCQARTALPGKAKQTPPKATKPAAPPAKPNGTAKPTPKATAKPGGKKGPVLRGGTTK